MPAAPGPICSTPTSITDVWGKLFFAADDGSRGDELWLSGEPIQPIDIERLPSVNANNKADAAVLVRDFKQGKGYNTVIVKDGNTCTSAAIAMTNLSDTPVFSEAASDALVGTTVDDAAIKAAMAAMLGDIDPSEDNRGPVAFKKHVAQVILRRAIARARDRAAGSA